MPKSIFVKTMKNNEITFLDFGKGEYKEVWERQEELMKGIIETKLHNESVPEEQKQKTPNWLIFVEHPHVYTLGKSGDEKNLLLNFIQLQAKDATFFKTDRGGDITYHGPGQIVGYPIFDLENFGLGLRQYINSTEEAIIKAIAEYGITGERDPHATGVWLDVGKPSARKICAIGVKSSRFVTMHGFALNVNTNLEYFKYINPCGFTDKAVTSIEKELGEKQDFEKVKQVVLSKIAEIFSGVVKKLENINLKSY
jgi:lipoyl(octanoyl) transferase